MTSPSRFVAPPLLSALLGDRDNNFNLIRFLAASAVLFSHSFALSSGDKRTEPLSQSLGITWGYIAVDVFFLTSGFLVTASLAGRKSLRSFAAARALRIYPALIVAVVLTVAAVGLAFTSLSAGEFFARAETWIYLLRNTTLITGVEHTLPGSFEHTPWRSAVNASLWTLPYELAMYLLLALLSLGVALSGVRRGRGLPLVVAAVALVAMALHLSGQQVLPGNAVRLTAMFFVGSTFYCFARFIRLDWRVFALLATAILASGVDRTMFWVVYTLALPYVVFCAAYLPRGAILQFNRLGDYSYGIYVYAWPVQQMTAALVPGIGAASMLLVSFSATLTLAVLSWHIVEKRALAWKRPRGANAASTVPSRTGASATGHVSESSLASDEMR